MNGMCAWCSEEGERVLHAASHESPNSTDVVDSDPTVVPSSDARDVRRLGGLSCRTLRN